MPEGRCWKSLFVAELIPSLQGLLVAFIQDLICLFACDSLQCMYHFHCMASAVLQPVGYCVTVCLQSSHVFLPRQFLWASLFCSNWPLCFHLYCYDEKGFYWYRLKTTKCYLKKICIVFNHHKLYQMVSLFKCTTGIFLLVMKRSWFDIDKSIRPT